MVRVVALPCLAVLSIIPESRPRIALPATHAGIMTHLPNVPYPVRMHPRVLAYPCDLVEAGIVFGTKPLTSPSCHFAAPTNPMALHPDYALPPPVPRAATVAASALAAEAPAAPVAAEGPKHKPGVLPASTPCILRPNALRECFSSDAATMKRGGYVQYHDIPVSLSARVHHVQV